MVAVIIIQQAPCHHSPLPPLKKGRMKERKHGDHPARYKKCSEQATQRGRSCEPYSCQDTKERAGSASRAASLALAPAPSPRHPPSEERHLAPAPPHARAPTRGKPTPSLLGGCRPPPPTGGYSPLWLSFYTGHFAVVTRGPWGGGRGG